MSLTAALVTLLAISAPGQDAATVRRLESEGKLQIPYCLVTPINIVRLSAAEAGPLVEVPVTEGMVVAKGDLLARTDDEAAKIKKKAANLKGQVARKQASTDITVKAAVLAAKVAKEDHQANRDIEARSPGAISATELRKSLLNSQHSDMKIEVAQLEYDMTKLTAEMEAATEEAADEEIARRQLTSPIGGVVDRVLAQVGEWVQPGQPIVEIVRLDRLRVETSLNAYEVSPRELPVGQPVDIEVQVGRDHVEKFTGKIGFVSQVVVADNYRIWVEFDNRKVGDDWAVSSGLKATLTVKLRQPAGRISAVSAPKPTRPN